MGASSIDASIMHAINLDANADDASNIDASNVDAGSGDFEEISTPGRRGAQKLVEARAQNYRLHRGFSPEGEAPHPCLRRRADTHP